MVVGQVLDRRLLPTRRNGSSRRLAREVQRLWIASIARQQDPEAIRQLDALGEAKASKRPRRTPSETAWERYLTRLDAAVSHAGATVIAGSEARTKGSRIAQAREGMRGILADYDGEPRVMRASVLRVLEAGRQIVLSLWELPPGEAAHPYEHRLGENRLLLVIDGRPILRTSQGQRLLGEGEVIHCVGAETVSSTLTNATEEKVRFLVLAGDAQIEFSI